MLIEGDDPAPRKALAELDLSEGTFEAAYKFAKLTLHIDVLDADVHRILGDALSGLKDFNRSIAEYETGLELKPKDTNIQLGLAETYLLVEKRDKAEKLVEEVLKKDDRNERALRLLERLK